MWQKHCKTFTALRNITPCPITSGDCNVEIVNNTVSILIYFNQQYLFSLPNRRLTIPVMTRQEATNLFVSARDPASSSYQIGSRTKCCSWRAQQPWSACDPARETLWTFDILYSGISFQKKVPSVVQHSVLLADFSSLARSVEDTCPGGWTWLEEDRSLKMCLQHLSPTL